MLMNGVCRRLRLFSFLFLITLPLLNCNAQFFKSGVTLEPLKDKNVQGTFTLILYGANHANDIATLALLDYEGDGYEFEPFAPEFSYRTKKHFPAAGAFSEAEKFVSWHNSFHSINLSKILDDKGNVMGYEIRPLYDPIAFGVFNVMDVYYKIRGNKVIVKIRLIDSLDRIFPDNEGRKGFFGID